METVLQFVLGVAIIAVGVALSIGLHEVGHLVPAKLFGIKVTQYMVGFGPTIFSRRRGETEYGFKAVPLGGYVAMVGMFPPRKGGAATAQSTGFFQSMIQDARQQSAESVGDDLDRAFYRKPVWQRIIVMLGGPFMNFVLAIVFFAITVCVFGTVQSSTTIGSVNTCVLPATSERQTCEDGDTPAPGAAAGIKPGDRLLSVAGTPIDSWAQSTSIIQRSAGDTVPVVVERDGQQVTLSVTPLLTERYVTNDDGTIAKGSDGQPLTQEVGFVGIGPASQLVQQPITAVFPLMGQTIGNTVNLVLNLPQRLVDVANAAFGSGERDPNGPISVVGVGRVAGEIATIDEIPLASKAATFFGMLGSLNIALGVINLVPLTPLDGGHVAAAIWEAIKRGFAKLRRKPDPGPVDAAKLMPLTFAVVIVFVGMSALLIYADIVKPINILG
ncbi:RIP metalloprotease [Humibacter sp. BT305]|uniref:Peptidase n=1 Tax=Cnuibacter physcomitrellae TaxID=1619308 RepID=A0A1X9LKV0_9MICO|nr:site-2 protease family protein [Cnuibacter physcomitrellae]ARJ05092.1 peptidase [Cnuibacter physcomitrellae]AXH36257.1 RIP metalloprotease [Humibacter sp. BT305]MCS5498740.1 site-2 protease family protein [Cnuibacter physcomitrellae]GGI34931.1 peptidase [Cnuibacter physcomitrellae]